MATWGHEGAGGYTHPEGRGERGDGGEIADIGRPQVMVVEEMVLPRITHHPGDEPVMPAPSHAHHCRRRR